MQDDSSQVHQKTPEHSALTTRLSTFVQIARLKQALKTGLAGVVAIYVARWVKLPEGYWAVISALIVMQSNIGATVSASWNRLISTAIGATIGGVFAIFWGNRPLVFGAAVALTVLICASLNLLESYRLAAVTVAIIMLVSGHSQPQLLALHRFLEVSLGIVVGVVVTAVVWPSRARESLRTGLSAILDDLNSLFTAIADRYRGQSVEPQAALVDKINAALRLNEDLVKQAVYEPSVSRAHQELIPLLMEQVENVAKNVEALELTTRLIPHDSYQAKFEPELGTLMTSISAGMGTLAGAVSNFKVSREWPNLPQQTAALDNKVARLRTAGELRNLELDEILRFFSFLLALKTLADELELAHKMSRRVGAGPVPETLPVMR